MTIEDTLELILERLDAIEAKLPTLDSLTSMATREDVKDLASIAEYAAAEIVDAERRRELNEMRADYRGLRAV